ncbi:p450 domain-containing protein [Cephalotus follicularis]|uniref:p450 domain-containing protein n=1 Tax=Cephalotus follicularis TaxID=3775 RepID=A0A1Q3CBL9_CEPFO|nr:p450 domain-containing protein [Cephalotus follicularis]
MDFSYHLLAVSGLLGLLVLYNLWRVTACSHNSKGMLAPEPSGALPIIGHLHQLGGQDTLARTLASMADKCGPIFRIRLGVYPTLVVSSCEAVKECFTTNDRILASRPRSNAGTYLGYNHAAFGFAAYGPFWREMRKIVMIELLSCRRLETLKHVQVSEVNNFIKDLFLFCKTNEHAPITTVISQKFELLSFNIIMRMIAGKRYLDATNRENDGEAWQTRKVIKEFMRISGVLGASEVIPFLGWMDLGGQVKAMKRVSRELDSLIGSWVEEHKQNRLNNEANCKQDFIDVMLSVIEDDFMFGYTKETIIKATAMNLILAGSDTTSIALTWILSNLLNNRQSMKIAQEELDLKVGRDRWVQESDIENLVYLKAIIKESLRLYPPGPIAVPHEAMEDCTIGSYHVSQGTRLIVNVWKLHRDPCVWSNPEEFSPERFIASHANIDVLGQNFELIPFGSGRRSCPGMTLALQVTHLVLARLLQGFELATLLNEPVDMTEGLAINLPKATPLEVVLTPRLSPQLYQP